MPLIRSGPTPLMESTLQALFQIHGQCNGSSDVLRTPEAGLREEDDEEPGVCVTEVDGLSILALAAASARTCAKYWERVVRLRSFSRCLRSSDL